MTGSPAAPRRFRARWVLPIEAAPIESGEVVVEGEHIAEVRPIPIDGHRAEDAVDLGNAILLPGIVNAHTHLDYTVLRGFLEDLPFFAWVRGLVAATQRLDEPDWVASATVGAAEALAGGVTTVADCSWFGAAMIGAKALGLRGIVYQEVFGIDEAVPVADAIRDLDTRVRALGWQASGTRLRAGVSPHALYTVRPELFRAIMRYAGERELPVCIHAAESAAESALTQTGTGPIAEMLAHRGIAWQTPGLSPIAYLASLGALTPQALLVHGVQVDEADAAIVTAVGASWAHCPKSNAKLANGTAPLHILRAEHDGRSAKVGLGSDSVASNNAMDLFEEMRFAVLQQRAVTGRHDELTARETLEMATIGGAEALGLADRIGSLEPGKDADLIAVSLGGLHASPCYDPYSALVYAARASDVRLAMVGGCELYEDGRFADVDPKPAIARLAGAAARLRAPEAAHDAPRD